MTNPMKFASALLLALESMSAASRSLVLRTWANTSTFQLIGKVNSAVTTEQAIIKAGGIDAYNELRGQDTDRDPPAGLEARITMAQLAEFNAAAIGAADTVAEGLDREERRFAYAMPLTDAFDFMATPKSKVTKDQIEAVREEEDSITDEQAIALLQQMQREDAAKLEENRELVLEHVAAGRSVHWDGEREVADILAHLPENYREAIMAKSIGKIVDELARSLPYALKGVPGVSAKRKLLKADLPVMEALAA